MSISHAGSDSVLFCAICQANRIREWAVGMAEFDDSRTPEEWIEWLRVELTGPAEAVVVLS